MRLGTGYGINREPINKKTSGRSLDVNEEVDEGSSRIEKGEWNRSNVLDFDNSSMLAVIFLTNVSISSYFARIRLRRLIARLDSTSC